jgi:hypothetical protein
VRVIAERHSEDHRHTLMCVVVVGVAIAGLLGLGIVPVRAQPQAGVSVEQVRLPRASELGVGDGIATIVRFDLRRYRLTFLTQRDGQARPLDRWVREHRLAAGINAGMFLPSGRPCGFVQLRGEVLNDRRPSSFQGVVAFDPLASSPTESMAVGGTGCAGGLDAMRARFGSVLQSNRVLIDCQGRATDWRTNRYSSASLGVDRDGRAVLVHVRTPYRMHVLSRMLAAPELGIRGLVYMEGGPEASLVVDAEGQRVTAMGSWEDHFHEADDLHELWDLPNVVGVERR